MKKIVGKVLKLNWNLATTNPMTKDQLQSVIEDMIADDENVLLADGFENAFVGISRQFMNSPIAVYDRKKCIDILMEDMSEEEAEEYFEFNVQGSYVGESTPAFIQMLQFTRK